MIGIIILPIKKFDKNINVLYSVFCIFSFEYFSFNKIKKILFIDLITYGKEIILSFIDSIISSMRLIIIL